MRLASHHVLWNLCPWIEVVIVEISQFETGDEQSTQTLVKISFLHLATTYSLRQMLVFRATLHIGTCQDSLSRSLCGILCHIVPLGEEIGDGTAIAGDQSIESPFVAQYLLLITVLTTAWLTVYTLIGTHDFGYLTFLYECFEGRQIGFP